MYSVRLLPQAERFYAKADRPIAKKLARCFEQLEQNLRNHPNITSLRGPLAGFYRYRVGDYRVVDRIDERARVLIVAIIAHRREAYE
jgi:mRNA interferase RelE/StbE